MEKEFSSHQINIMKVALAIAIIRQKPEGVSTVQHVQDLAVQFRESQISWKSKASQLEYELLRVRQELVSTQLLARAYENGADDSEQFLSSGYSSQQTFSDQAKQTAVVSDTGVISLVNDRGNSCTLSQIRMEEQLERHLRFLKSASSLKLCQESLSTLVSCDFLSTLSDSMVAALTDIGETVGSGNLSILTAGSLCCPSIADNCANALKSDQLGIHRAEVLAAASKLLLAILNKLEGTICSQDGRHLEDLKKMVYVLSQVEELYTLIMEHMVSMVTSGVEHLQKCIEDPSQLGVSMIMALGVAIGILDQLITDRWRSYSNNPIATDIVHSLLTLVETTLLDISHCFPLVSHSLWRLHFLLLNQCHI